jgi:hypothetical protein
LDPVPLSGSELSGVDCGVPGSGVVDSGAVVDGTGTLAAGAAAGAGEPEVAAGAAGGGVAMIDAGTTGAGGVAGIGQMVLRGYPGTYSAPFCPHADSTTATSAAAITIAPEATVDLLARLFLARLLPGCRIMMRANLA